MEQYHHKKNEKLLTVRQFAAVGFSCLTHCKQLQASILYPALCTSLVFWLHPEVNVCFRMALQYFGSANLSDVYYFLNCTTPPPTNSISFQEICLYTCQKFHRRHQYNTRYEPDGSGFETPAPGWRSGFPYPSRTVLRPTQYPVWWVGLFMKSGRVETMSPSTPT